MILWRASLNRCLDCLECFLDGFVSVAGPAFIILAVVLISGGVYTFFNVHLVILQMPILVYYFNFILGIQVSIAIFFNFYMAVTTNPGSTDPFQNVEVLHDESSLLDSNGEEAFLNVEQNSQPKKCRKCQKIKPERTHHCSVCKRCVLKMDHHCPWIHNCVGHYNHRYFYLFCAYMTFGCLYFFITSIPILQQEFFSHNKVLYPNDGLRIALIFYSFLTAAIGVALGAMTLWHTYLIASGQTIIEFYENKYLKRLAKVNGEAFINEYDLGTHRNFMIFFNFGSRYKWWTVLLPIPVPPVGNGSTWLTSTTFLSTRTPLKDLGYEEELREMNL